MFVSLRAGIIKQDIMILIINRIGDVVKINVLNELGIGTVVSQSAVPVHTIKFWLYLYLNELVS